MTENEKKLTMFEQSLREQGLQIAKRIPVGPDHPLYREDKERWVYIIKSPGIPNLSYTQIAEPGNWYLMDVPKLLGEFIGDRFEDERMKQDVYVLSDIP